LNCGLSAEEINEVVVNLVKDPSKVYDAAASEYGHPLDVGLLDSQPAVKEAVRSAVSIATLLSTLGGVIVFARNSILDSTEAVSFHGKMREVNESSSEDIE